MHCHCGREIPGRTCFLCWLANNACVVLVTGKVRVMVCVDPQAGKGEWLPGQNYRTPLDGSTAAAMDRAWQQLLAQDSCAGEAPITLPVMYGRTLEVGVHLCPPLPTSY